MKKLKVREYAKVARGAKLKKAKGQYEGMYEVKLPGDTLATYTYVAKDAPTVVRFLKNDLETMLEFEEKVIDEKNDKATEWEDPAIFFESK